MPHLPSSSVMNICVTLGSSITFIAGAANTSCSVNDSRPSSIWSSVMNTDTHILRAFVSLALLEVKVTLVVEDVVDV